MIEVTRIGDGPILDPGHHPGLGDNLNGPSLVRVPDSIPNRLGRYYLYFSHHKGQHIRLACADNIEGPWQIHPPGVMPLAASPFAQTKPDVPQPAWAVTQGEDGLYPHLASPDVLIREDDSFEMYVHGLDPSGEQVTWRATSPDGLDWHYHAPLIPETYMRIFQWQGETYAMARSSRFWFLGKTGWQSGEIGIDASVRHVAVLVRENRLHVMFTRIGDAPEHILHTSIALDTNWRDWKSDQAADAVLFPEHLWEGAEQPATKSRIGAIGFSNALRDPCLFQEEGQVWMIYAGAGEHALGLARVTGL